MSYGLSSTAAWYVIQTKPKKETETFRSLCGRGYQCLFPKILDYRSANGRTIEIQKPLFPGYLFIKLILAHHYYQVKWTKGLSRFVGWGNIPTPVADGIVEAIRSRTDEGGKVRMGLDVKPSEEVRIKSGPLKDFIGIFERKLSERDRIRVLLHVVGSQVSVNVPASLVECVR